MASAERSTPRVTEELVATAQHPAREMLTMFVGNRAAMVASIILMAIVLAAIFGPMLHPVDPFEMVWAPSHPLVRTDLCLAQIILAAICWRPC